MERCPAILVRGVGVRPGAEQCRENTGDLAGPSGCLRRTGAMPWRSASAKVMRPLPLSFHCATLARNGAMSGDAERAGVFASAGSRTPIPAVLASCLRVRKGCHRASWSWLHLMPSAHGCSNSWVRPTTHPRRGASGCQQLVPPVPPLQPGTTLRIGNVPATQVIQAASQPNAARQARQIIPSQTNALVLRLVSGVARGHGLPTEIPPVPRVARRPATVRDRAIRRCPGAPRR